MQRVELCFSPTDSLPDVWPPRGFGSPVAGEVRARETAAEPTRDTSGTLTGRSRLAGRDVIERQYGISTPRFRGDAAARQQDR